MTLTKRQKEIIKLASDLIAKSGIQALTIKNLAERLGVTEPALYRHFSNKNAILLAMIDDYADDAASAFEHCDDGSLMGVEAFVRSRFALAVRRPALVLALNDEALFRNEPEIAEHLRAVRLRDEETLSELFAAAQRNREIRSDIDHRLLTLLTLAPAQALIRRWGESGRSFDLMEQGNLLWSAMRLAAL